jgi:tRNA threonylcarbamoyl adenosine modification protein (Sua5/YciO/YrdC/YwlC family)
MNNVLELHPQNPQIRLVQRVLACLREGGLILYPTDSTYAYGWLPESRAAQARVERAKRLNDKHLYAIACRDLKQAAQFGKIDNHAFAVMKRHTPGPFTFILPATSLLPKRLAQSKRRTIGVRIPDSPLVAAMLAELDEPLMTSSVDVSSRLEPNYTCEELAELLAHEVDLFVDTGVAGYESTTLIDLSGDQAVVLRQGRGQINSI